MASKIVGEIIGARREGRGRTKIAKLIEGMSK